MLSLFGAPAQTIAVRLCENLRRFFPLLSGSAEINSGSISKLESRSVDDPDLATSVLPLDLSLFPISHSVAPSIDECGGKRGNGIALNYESRFLRDAGPFPTEKVPRRAAPARLQRRRSNPGDGARGED
jgi:hypothetical protein